MCLGVCFPRRQRGALPPHGRLAGTSQVVTASSSAAGGKRRQWYWEPIENVLPRCITPSVAATLTAALAAGGIWTRIPASWRCRRRRGWGRCRRRLEERAFDRQDGSGGHRRRRRRRRGDRESCCAGARLGMSLLCDTDAPVVRRCGTRQALCRLHRQRLGIAAGGGRCRPGPASRAASGRGPSGRIHMQQLRAADCMRRTGWCLAGGGVRRRRQRRHQGRGQRHRQPCENSKFASSLQGPCCHQFDWWRWRCRRLQ